MMYFKLNLYFPCGWSLWNFFRPFKTYRFQDFTCLDVCTSTWEKRLFRYTGTDRFKTVSKWIIIDFNWERERECIVDVNFCQWSWNGVFDVKEWIRVCQKSSELKSSVVLLVKPKTYFKSLLNHFVFFTHLFYILFILII